ncbi:envelope stress response protein PspG [Escherichia coli]|nr:envelope stress response protein PspG [Escherichia coli]EJQ0366422.1 envelope stress response protein PspG [Escherichia coli]
MLELLFVIGFFVMLMVTGVSLLGIIAALVVATAIMFLGGMLALMIKLLPWLLLAIAYSAAIFLIPICISFDTAEKRRYATYLILNRRFSFEF